MFCCRQARSGQKRVPNIHTSIELLAYYCHYILAPNPSNIKAIKAAASTYDNFASVEENAANLFVGISAMQPHDVTTQYQKLELLKTMIQGLGEIVIS